MKRVLVVLGIVCLLAGCSGLQARGDMAKLIDANAANAVEVQQRAMLGGYSTDQAKVVLSDNAATFSAYADAATGNIFAYWFGGKTILTNATHYDDLQHTAAAAIETDRRAKAGTLPVTQYNPIIAKQASVLIRVADAKAGKAGAQ